MESIGKYFQKICRQERVPWEIHAYIFSVICQGIRINLRSWQARAFSSSKVTVLCSLLSLLTSEKATSFSRAIRVRLKKKGMERRAFRIYSLFLPRHSAFPDLDRQKSGSWACIAEQSLRLPWKTAARRGPHCCLQMTTHFSCGG
jgi:hypothetical protein